MTHPFYLTQSQLPFQGQAGCGSGQPGLVAGDPGTVVLKFDDI